MRTLKIFELNPDYTKRVFGLDLMRALAIIFVIMRHDSMLEKANTAFPWIRLIDGVELFFVLSGFLIGGMLIKIFQDKERMSMRVLWNFWIRRWFRTLPNYYLVLILNVVFAYVGLTMADLDQFNWKFFLFLHNFSQPFYGFFWESWSLSIEEWFYLLFPIVLGGLYIFSKGRMAFRRALFLIAIAMFFFTPILLRLFIASSYDVDRFWLGVRVLKVVVFRLDGIALGLLAAYLKYWHPELWYKSRNWTFVLGLVLSYATLYLPWPPNDFSTKVFMITLVSTGCFLFLPKFDSMRKAPKIVVKSVTHISLISYSMYLINLGLVADVIGLHFPPQDPLSARITYVVYWVIVIGASTLLYKYYEKPLTDLRDKWNWKSSESLQ